jgi:FtsH-binding integral membrane protein
MTISLESLAGPRSTPTPLGAHAVGLLVLFAIQFLAGMVLNLFIDIPKHHPGTIQGDYFSRSWESLVWALSGGAGWALVVHATIALILFLGTVFLFLRSLTPSGRGWRWGSGVAAFVTLGALFNGLSFLDFNEDFSSMIMASCWLVVVSILVLMLVRSRLRSAQSH